MDSGGNISVGAVIMVHKFGTTFSGLFVAIPAPSCFIELTKEVCCQKLLNVKDLFLHLILETRFFAFDLLI